MFTHMCVSNISHWKFNCRRQRECSLLLHQQLPYAHQWSMVNLFPAPLICIQLLPKRLFATNFSPHSLMTDFFEDNSSRQAEQNNLPAEPISCSPRYCLTRSRGVTFLGSVVDTWQCFTPVGGLQVSLHLRARKEGFITRRRIEVTWHSLEEESPVLLPTLCSEVDKSLELALKDSPFIASYTSH